MTTSLNKTGVTTLNPLAVIGYSSTQATGNVLHEILGRSDVDVTFAAAGLRSGTLTYLFSTLAQALACRDMHASVGKVIFADTDLPSLNMIYVLSGNIVLELDDDSQYWTVAVDYQEVSS